MNPKTMLAWLQAKQGRHRLTIPNHISDVGDERTAAHRRFAFELECARTIRNTTPENALKLARVFARGLVNCGYTPRWLDHDFPLPAKTTTGKEEESSPKTRGHTPSVKK